MNKEHIYNFAIMVNPDHIEKAIDIVFKECVILNEYLAGANDKRGYVIRCTKRKMRRIAKELEKECGYYQYAVYQMLSDL